MSDNARPALFSNTHFLVHLKDNCFKYEGSSRLIMQDALPYAAGIMEAKEI